MTVCVTAALRVLSVVYIVCKVERFVSIILNEDYYYYIILSSDRQTDRQPDRLTEKHDRNYIPKLYTTAHRARGVRAAWNT